MKLKKYYKQNQDRFAEDLFELIRYDLSNIADFLLGEDEIEYKKNKQKTSWSLFPDEKSKIAVKMIQDLIKRLQ
jgi:hypothetical protein